MRRERRDRDFLDHGDLVSIEREWIRRRSQWFGENARVTSQVHEEEDSSTSVRPIPASADAINNLRRRIIRIEDKGEEIECTICQEGVEIGTILAQMPCQHEYHDICIRQWLALNGTCPICRFTLCTSHLTPDPNLWGRTPLPNTYRSQYASREQEYPDQELQTGVYRIAHTSSTNSLTAPFTSRIGLASIPVLTPIPTPASLRSMARGHSTESATWYHDASLFTTNISRCESRNSMDELD
ncbi:hypothetical protein BDF14DRAFT_1000 [Spinellus fusiger]|nr:hypothetical protein BDF14DRAFT_1000 [Spinellus fusiger]